MISIVYLVVSRKARERTNRNEDGLLTGLTSFECNYTVDLYYLVSLQNVNLNYFILDPRMSLKVVLSPPCQIHEPPYISQKLAYYDTNGKKSVMLDCRLLSKFG